MSGNVGVESLLDGSIIHQSTSSLNEYKTAVIDVQGMTCHSCVNNIQDNIRSKDGIKSIVVSLQNCEDNLVSAESDNPKYREAIIDIQGMTCHSCVNNIQDNMSSKDGIQSIVVSLKDCEGV
ncbi:unnamed protein product [Anisakis simplex]|uniref:HMA domain-containing protein n=1 Tax=Anisakis simplex TaxID=6269 RepID=A0A0M3KK54_ANISI|nr:unnamed protein product [Anisakis simplex]